MENDNYEEHDLDPRIQVELENLNTATDEINKLEIELDEANTTFRMLLNESTRRLKLLSKKLGGCIERARPYYEAVEVAKKAQLECQKAAVLFQRANEIHAAAKETVALAEQRFMTNQHEWQFDNAWQEMLNHATIKVYAEAKKIHIIKNTLFKVMDAETQKAASGREHQMRATLFTAAEQKVQQLEEKLRRHIIKSRPYFEEKAICQDQLNTQKERIECLQKNVSQVKFSYSQSLKKLELISEEIHQKRKKLQKEEEVPCGPREPGVGAELNSPNDEFNVKQSLPDISFELDRCDIHSMGTLSGPASSGVSEKDDNEEVEDLEESELSNLKFKVKQLAIRPIDGGEGCSFDNIWESELNATVDKLDHMLLMKECAEQLNNFKVGTSVKESTEELNSYNIGSSSPEHTEKINNFKVGNNEIEDLKNMKEAKCDPKNNKDITENIYTGCQEGELKRRHFLANQNEECPSRDLASEPDDSSDGYEEIENVPNPSKPDIIPPPKDVVDMGQKPSSLPQQSKPKLSLTWILRNQQTTHNPHPEQPIKFQYKTRRKSVESSREKPNAFDSSNNKVRLNNEVPVGLVNAPARTKSEPSLTTERVREKHRHKKRGSRSVKQEKGSRFGYEIHDVDEFLTKASLDKPANIPVVLAFPSVLYQTRLGGYQQEISLPLGMVVNAVFKNQSWLYVQTPHLEEGYVNYKAILPLGILPPRDDEPAPCWEKHSDVFPKPCGNMTDTEKLSSKSECSIGRCRRKHTRNALSCEERSVDKLYLKATANARNSGIRQTLLVIGSDYASSDKNTISVMKGDVVKLVSAHVKNWFWIKTRDGTEGFIPAVVAGHGFL